MAGLYDAVRHNRVGLRVFDWRTLLLGVAAFGATFAGGIWLGAGNLPSLVGQSVAEIRSPRALAETLPTDPLPLPVIAPATVAAVSSARIAPPAPVERKGLTDDDRLRQSVVLQAEAYLKPACKPDSKALYVAAATRYAEVLMRSAGCSQFPKCPMSPSLLDGVWQGNRSPLDQPVADAMAEVHAAGGLSDKSFRGDVGRAVRVIAGRDFAKGPAPACRTALRPPRLVRVRWRR